MAVHIFAEFVREKGLQLLSKLHASTRFKNGYISCLNIVIINLFIAI